jgi:hypothetical protein
MCSTPDCRMWSFTWPWARCFSNAAVEDMLLS